MANPNKKQEMTVSCCRNYLLSLQHQYAKDESRKITDNING